MIIFQYNNGGAKKLLTAIHWQGFQYLSRPIFSYLNSNSLYISHAASNFYGTEIEIWAGFGPFGSTEKKFGPIMSNFRGRFLPVFIGKKIC